MTLKCRKWSNKELKKFAHLFTGNVLNVSAWKDEDKEGAFYRDYFKNISEYKTSNLDLVYRSFTGNEDYLIDLESNISCEKCYDRFDVVFNHTTLEHIFMVGKAINRLCKMSKDIVIIVVPKQQEYHPGEGWDDYWRFTKGAIEEMFRRQDMKLLYFSEGGGNDPIGLDGTYYFAIASKKPELWKNKI